MSSNTLLLEFRGRKSGRALSTPISYHVDEGSDHCFTNRNFGWWRNLTTQNLLASLMEPLVKLNYVRPDGAATFMRLLGRAYTESQGHLKRFMRDKYGHMLARFTALIQKANPKLDNLELFWRLHLPLCYSGYRKISPQPFRRSPQF